LAQGDGWGEGKPKASTRRLTGSISTLLFPRGATGLRFWGGYEPESKLDSVGREKEEDIDFSEVSRFFLMNITLIDYDTG
jgi:hypothetical protein